MRNRTGKRQGEWQSGYWTEEEARGVLTELAASGQSVAEFSRRTGVSRARLAYWQKRVALSATTDFVAVDLAGVSAPKCFEIVAAGVMVRVREDLDVDHVARLVEAIGRRVGGAC